MRRDGARMRDGRHRCGFGAVRVALWVWLVGIVAAGARAADQWTLTTGDFTEQRIALSGIGDGEVSFVQKADGIAGRLPLEQLLEVARVEAEASAPGAFTVYLSGGGRITGRAVVLEGETLRWNNPLLKDLEVSLRQVRAVVRSGEKQDPSEAAEVEDVVLLQNGDRVEGIVTALDGEGVTLSRGGNAVPVGWDSVRAVRFVSTGAAGTAPDFRVTLSDGSVVPVKGVVVAGTRVRLTLPSGREAQTALGSLVRIEQVNGPVRWLASLAPATSEQVPYLPGATPQPARMNQTVKGEPITVKGQVYRHGIGVHAYSRLVFELEPGFEAFRTRYALGPGQYANVVVRIKLDDRVVYEAQDAEPGALSEVIRVPLEGARRLTLEVDYGQGLDVQDQLDWIEPALVR